MNEFDNLKVGDAVRLVQGLKAVRHTVTELDADTVILDNGRAFRRSTGFACDGAIVFIQAFVPAHA